jgi:DNA-binding NarL/FixJ family response regulator
LNKTRVFLADDHVVVREGLKVLINAQPEMEVSREAGDGRTACQKIKEQLPDVVVMDVSMPEMNGAQATEELKRECPQVKVLTLTVNEDRGYLRLLLEAGASGYVLKRAAAEDLIHAIRAVAAGGIYVDPTMAGSLVGGFVRKPAGKGVPEATGLSDRETEVVRLIAAGYSNKEIAGRLELSVKTVETYKARSLEKLGLHSRADLVRYAVQHGWLPEG